jgi:hypothetical protein
MIIFSESALKNFTGGYGFGDLYLWNKPTERLVPNYSSYDCKTKNFHIISNDVLGIEKKIEELRIELMKEIKESNLFWTKNRSNTYEDERPKYNPFYGNKSSKNIDPLQLEKYIGVTYENHFHMLCFERMYIDEKKICNVLGAIQYYKYLMVEGKDTGINKDSDGNLDICYPLKGETMRKKQDGREITNSEYNIYSDVKAILDEFYKFIVNQD